MWSWYFPLSSFYCKRYSATWFWFWCLFVPMHFMSSFRVLKVSSNLQPKKVGTSSECTGLNLFYRLQYMSIRDTLALGFWLRSVPSRYIGPQFLLNRVCSRMVKNLGYSSFKFVGQCYVSLDMALRREIILKLVLFRLQAQNSVSEPAIRHVDGLLKHI